MRDMLNDRGQIGARNVIAAVVVGMVSATAIMIWGVPGLDPSMWDEVAVVSGLRPPKTIFPGLWRVLVGWLFPTFGMDAAVGMLSVLGALVAGLCTALVCLITRQVLAMLIRTQHQYPVWSNRIAPFFAMSAAVLFGISDPLWRIARVLSADELRLLLLLVITHLVLRWFAVGGRWRLFPAMALMGVMAAESPFGFAMPLVFVGFYVSVWHCVMDGLFPWPERLPEPVDMPKWRMLFLFLGGIAVTAWINAFNFAALGGIEANGWNINYVYFLYGASYWHVLLNAASVVGWVLGFGFCVIPLFVAIRLFPTLVGDDRPMPFGRGALMFFLGALTSMQSGAFASTKFWMFAKEVVQIDSGFLLAFFVTCALITVAIFGAAFAFECQCTYLTDEDGNRKPGIMLRALVPMMIILLVALAAYKVPRPVASEMQKIVDDAIAETVDECKAVKWLFTDGLLDTGLEIEIARRGLTLWPLNMMSGSSDWENSLHRRYFKEDSEEYKALEVGVPTLLRVWAGEKPNGMDEVAIQLGFEFWKRERKPMPVVSGMVAKEKWDDPVAVSNGIVRAEAISKRILAIAGGMDDADPSPALASAISAVSWRLSRFARLRKDAELADNLDLTNGALKHMLSIIEQERTRTFMKLTPKEGLQMALRRADFNEAKRYATTVLQFDEDDPEANFGMGMNAIRQDRMTEAEQYLTRCLKRRPKEPAVLNNLSIVCRKLRKYKESEEYARRALKILPASLEVRETLDAALKKAP